jgi:hypothetical protein
VHDDREHEAAHDAQTQPTAEIRRVNQQPLSIDIATLGAPAAVLSGVAMRATTSQM